MKKIAGVGLLLALVLFLIPLGLRQQARQGGKVHTKMGKGGQGHVPAHAVTAIKEKMLHLIMTPL